MPYNTRRKSLSLESLGIHVPVTNAARAAAAAANRASLSASSSASSSSATPGNSNNNSNNPPSGTSSPSEYSQTKRLKRAHIEDSPSKAPPATRIKHEHTPPPSPQTSPPPPPHSRSASTDPARTKAPKKEGTDPINDVIVEAVIAQLEVTGNRPHLVKELAAVLAQRLTIVQHSANPCAIISSRLASFLKRTCWAESRPCPVAKELEAVHPRRTYFFLTSAPRQPFPTQPLLFSFPKPTAAPSTTTASPSISGDETPSFDIDFDDDADISDLVVDTEIRADRAARREMSPSPEVDLSSPEFDDMEEDVDSGSMSMSMTMSMGSSRTSLQIDRERRARGASPPLERDEREFTQTANGLQKRRIVQEHAAAAASLEAPALSLDENARFDSLFYDYRSGGGALASMAMVLSPTMKASPFGHGNGAGSSLKKESEDSWVKIERLLDWDRTPETMELEELDCLLDAYDAY